MKNGSLYCPKCKSVGMNGYTNWESRNLNNNKRQYIFYKNITKQYVWICWIIFKFMGCDLNKWYDPFNLLDSTDSFEDEIIDENSWEMSWLNLIIAIKINFSLFIITLLFIIYFIIFIWFDIYYWYSDIKKYKVLLTGNHEEIISDDENIWKKITSEDCTEEFWCDNYSDKFICNKCPFKSCTFYDFFQPEEIIISIDDDLNNSTDIITIDNYEQGNEILLEFISSDQLIKGGITVHSNNLFKKAIKKISRKYPQLLRNNYFYLSNGNILKHNKTIEENKLKSGDVILICNEEGDEIFVEFISNDQKVKETIKTLSNELFGDTVKKLIDKYPRYKDKKYYYLCHGKKLEFNLTLEQNGVHSKDVIQIHDQTIRLTFYFLSEDKIINEALNIDSKILFSDITNKLSEKYPKLKDNNFYYLCGVKKINPNNTVHENKCRDKDEIRIYFGEPKEVIVNLISEEEKFNESYKIFSKTLLCDITHKFLEKYPQFRNSNAQFICNGHSLRQDYTLEQNHIKSGDLIYYKKM